MKRIFDFLPLFAFPASVFLAHVIAFKVFDLYSAIPNIDIPVHFIGGLSIAYAAARVLSYLEREEMIALLDRIVFLVLIVALTATAAVFWEFAEFGVDQWFHTNVQISLANTMQDQFMGLCGGMSWAFLLAFSRFQIGHLA